MVRRIDYVGGSYPMEEREDGEYVEYDDYEALEARVAELEKDAARYRWLRDVGYGKATRILTNMAFVADCLIDEAMSREA